MIAWLTGVALAVYSYKWHPKQRRAQLRSKMHEAPEKKKYKYFKLLFLNKIIFCKISIRKLPRNQF